MSQYLFVASTLQDACVFSNDQLATCTERHKIKLDLPDRYSIESPIEELKRNENFEGVVIEMFLGWVGRPYLRLAAKILETNCRVWLYWPDEETVEHLDKEKLQSLWRHWAFVQFYKQFYLYLLVLKGPLKMLLHPKRFLRAVFELLQYYYKYGDIPTFNDQHVSTTISEELERVVANTNPVPMPNVKDQPTVENPVEGIGVYLRTDFWVKLNSGGSYGHTCHVAKELAAITQNFICFMSNHYSLLDDFGLQQIVLDRPGKSGTEEELLLATKYYYQALKPAFQALRPAYIYERLCLGNYAGAMFSQELNIPYIVEYNGSEISMTRSFEGRSYTYEKIFLKAEEAAFRQATLISVVSERVKEDLVSRNIAPEKILVNPNGADPKVYSPLPETEKLELRRELELDSATSVIGFIGTFGAWHGIDVLAKAIPEICKNLPDVNFLLIGDGNLKELVDKQVRQHNLFSQVKMTGRVPQDEGVRLLGACDIYVSPHNSHMVDSRFFGSPTKIFEYMAMGGGIVSSDLEQIGQVLSPALYEKDLTDMAVNISNQRAILCVPGDVDEFVKAVTFLVQRPELCQILGKNARQAVIDYYSWDQHVANLWYALRNKEELKSVVGTLQFNSINRDQTKKIETGDVYKDQVQYQWNNNPVGSQYVKEAQSHTLEWFLEVEAHRYGEYAPWMPEVMEFAEHSDKQILEIGGGIGTDLCQFAKHGAHVTDLDLSLGHLELAQENFKLRNLPGRFIHHDAEELPFDDKSFDIVYSNGVIHHTPNTTQVVQEIYRVLKPGGRAIIMVYAENSLHYWRILVGEIGLKKGMLQKSSIGEVMSRSVEISENNARPLVKVYTKKRLKNLFEDFENIEIVQRQLTAGELPGILKWIPVDLAGKLMGWNLIIKANKPKD